MTPYGGHRSRDKRKSRFANPNKYAWDYKGRLIGKKRFDRAGNMTIIPLTRKELAELKPLSHGEL